MLTELTFAILKYGFLALLWVFLWLAIRSLRKDIETFSPKVSRTQRKRQRAAKKAVPPAAPAPVSEQPADSRRGRGSSSRTNPALLVVIDGPLAGSSLPLSQQPITLGRASSNSLILDDEFVSSHHARVYQDPVSGEWAIEDLGSTNGTVVADQRIQAPTILPAGVPVRIGATTFELR
ncbi:FHA domain-containing protein [Bombiscardovia apis]|uniref:FHA domain-containing protein n=1 Tax=Bombiscardovia apis TaxID=2932182 RepID=A0ABN6SGC1_9BIFI|nr:FHA domain-containing protein [Bombiscardovia apis]BDR53946.1 FHA domain-containing protein [Bombiscardovia apis]